MQHDSSAAMQEVTNRTVTQKMDNAPITKQTKQPSALETGTQKAAKQDSNIRRRRQPNLKTLPTAQQQLTSSSVALQKPAECNEHRPSKARGALSSRPRNLPMIAPKTIKNPQQHLHSTHSKTVHLPAPTLPANTVKIPSSSLFLTSVMANVGESRGLYTIIGRVYVEPAGMRVATIG